MVYFSGKCGTLVVNVNSLVSNTLTRVWLKLACYQPTKHFAEKKAVFLATPENLKVVGGGFPALIGHNVRKTRGLP